MTTKTLDEKKKHIAEQMSAAAMAGPRVYYGRAGSGGQRRDLRFPDGAARARRTGPPGCPRSRSTGP